MLGFIGRWAASKGMKLLPSWIGTDKTTAQTQIVTEGFKVGAVTQSNSDVSSEAANHNKVISQTPAAASAQDYETPVNLTWRNFSFTPFSVFGFSPFNVFGFSPFNVFGFSPTEPFSVFGFSPTEPFSVFGFSPTPPFNVFGFSPTPSCIDEETLVATVGPDNSIIMKQAKQIQIGDEVYSAIWDELIDESFGDPFDTPSSTLSNVRMNTTTVVNSIPSVKATTMYLNGDVTRRFSLEENILVKRDSEYQFVNSGNVIVGDKVIQKNEFHTFDEIDVEEVTVLDEERVVYTFNCEPTDTLIAANVVVHNRKVF
jgi:hypothetical protein